MQNEPLFTAAHDALIYAYNYAGQQSPKSPIAGLVHRGGLGKGRGLHGIDGAAQAGIILAATAKLAMPQQHVLRVRFGRHQQPCPHCQVMGPCAEWVEAVDALSRSAELAGVHRAARHLLVEKAVCGLRGTSIATIAANYQLVERTLHKQMQTFRRKMEKLEVEAMNAADNLLRDRGVVG
jgi:hypothetical protein